MKLRLRDRQAKDNVINENNYIDLLHVASEPLHDGIDPLQAWIMHASMMMMAIHLLKWLKLQLPMESTYKGYYLKKLLETQKII